MGFDSTVRFDCGLHSLFWILTAFLIQSQSFLDHFCFTVVVVCSGACVRGFLCLLFFSQVSGLCFCSFDQFWNVFVRLLSNSIFFLQLLHFSVVL